MGACARNMQSDSAEIKPAQCCIKLVFHLTFIKYINNCPTRCNTKQSIYYSASSLYMFRVSTTPIIMCTQNCNYSLRYWSYFLCSLLPPTWPSHVGRGSYYYYYYYYYYCAVYVFMYFLLDFSLNNWLLLPHITFT